MHGDFHLWKFENWSSFPVGARSGGGARVRLIVDAVGSLGLGRDHFDELVAAGGAMCWFNELRLASFSFRDHRKVLRRLDPELAALKLQAWHLRTGRPERRWQGLSMRRMEQVLVRSQPPA